MAFQPQIVYSRIFLPVFLPQTGSITCVFGLSCDDPLMTPLRLRQRPLLCPDLRWSTAFHPVLARVYATRVTDPTDLLLRWEVLPPFRLLTDIDRAAHRLADAVQGQEQVAIAGDYERR